MGADHTAEMWINQEKPVRQDLPELLPPTVLYALIRRLPAVDATVAVKCLRAVRPTLASAVGRLECNAYALRLVVVGDSEMRKFDVRGRFFMNLASHGDPVPK